MNQTARTSRLALTAAATLAVAALFSTICAAGSINVSFQEGVGGYASTQDTYISGMVPTAVNGTVTNVRISGTTTQPYVNKQIPLLRFDDIMGAGAGQIPLGAIIDSATLTLVSGDTFAANSAIFQLTADWNESVNWNTSFGADGVDASETAATADASIGALTAGAAYALDVASSLQAWADGAPNYGWAFLTQINVNPNPVLYWTSEAAANQRPLLEVTYTTSRSPRPWASQSWA